MEPEAFEATVRAIAVPKECTREQFAAFLLVAKEYGLNPLTKEIYAFPGKNGVLQPIVGVDGWLNLANSHPMFDGMEFEDHFENGVLVAVTAIVYRKDRRHASKLTEYMAECKRGTDTWRQWPARMLRHKAAIQCIRYAFGFAGIMEPDEYERMIAVETTLTVDAVAPPSSRTESLKQRIGVITPAPAVLEANPDLVEAEPQAEDQE
jgi:phage recombination protein Bet